MSKEIKDKLNDIDAKIDKKLGFDVTKPMYFIAGIVVLVILSNLGVI